MDKDEFYQDILGGLGVYFESALIKDILETAHRFPDPTLGHALNPNQIASKKWLLDSLYAAAGGRFDTIHVLGGWYGILSALLANDRRFNVERLVSIDIDPGCRPIAESLNATHVATGRFQAVTADMLSLDYAPLAAPGNLIINTSCEHLGDFAAWYERIPRGGSLVMQSNDYYGCDEHVNCVPDIDTFARQAPLSRELFSGSKRLKKYTRFMRVGIK